MKSLRSIPVLLLSMIIALMVVQTTAAARGKNGQKGNGGQAPTASLGIEAVLLTNLGSGEVRAEISGGGFNNGAYPEVTLVGSASLDVIEVADTMIVANIPAGTLDGSYTLAVSTGDDPKQSATTTIGLGGTMTVACIDWFRSGPNDEHVHTEVHIEDADGNAVVGATVTWTAENESGVYQTNVSATNNNDGHANGAGCADPTGSGVTDWFCCIGAGKWDNDGPPGKRACDPGFYTAVILDVSPPAQTNMVWDEVSPDNGIDLDPQQP
jgi:hypothetical protein